MSTTDKVMDLDEKLTQEIDETVKLYEQYIPTSANATRAMIARKGYIKALSDLMKSGEIQKGFKTLVENNHKGKTFEAIIIRNKEYFSEDVVKAAEFRLANHDVL